MPRHDPSEKTKTEILQTAVRLFQDKGWDKVKIEDIVKEVGVTRGAFYHYFKSREDLVAAVANQIFLDNNPFVATAKQRGLNSLEKIRFAIKLNIRFNLNNKEYLSAVKKVSVIPEIMKGDILTAVNTFAPYMEYLLKEGIKEGIVSVKYPKQTAQALSLLMNIWFYPVLFQAPYDEFEDKLSFMILLGELLCGEPFIDDELAELMREHYKALQDV